jgi:hypothetical protein
MAKSGYGHAYLIEIELKLQEGLVEKTKSMAAEIT